MQEAVRARNDGAQLALVGKNDVAQGLASVIRRLSAARSLDEIMQGVTYGVRLLLQADGGTFVLRDRDHCHYVEEDAVSPLWKGKRFPMSACISGLCMTTGEAVTIADIYKDPRIPVDLYRPTFVRSLAMVPVGRDEPVAALGAYWSEVREPRVEEIECLQAIADAASLALAALRPRAEMPGRRLETVSSWVRRSVQGFITSVRLGLRPNPIQAYALSIVCIIAATSMRWAIEASGVLGLAVFSTYYPAVLLAMLIGGRRAGVLAAVLGGLLAYYMFIPPQYQFTWPPSLSDILDLALYGSACALIILIVGWYQSAVLCLRQEDAKHLTLAREQRHRVRNALAVAEAIVDLSLRDEPDRARIIGQRLRSGLADVELEDRAAETPVGLRDLLMAELEPYDLARIRLRGDERVVIASDSRRLLTLAAHELATNALKYGALSVPEGFITVTWRRVDSRRIVVNWGEAGGPPVRPPGRRDYGSIMLRRLIEAQGGTLAMDFRRSGVTAEISLALDGSTRSRSVRGAEI